MNSSLPTINACLNASSAVLLSLGYAFVRQGRIAAHRACMLGALACSALFLASYLYYHYHVGSVSFQGTGWVRTVYFSILISHTILAVAVLPLIFRSFWFAWREKFDRHRNVARWALPIWLYVSVTGVLVYGMLYLVQWN